MRRYSTISAVFFFFFLFSEMNAGVPDEQIAKEVAQAVAELEKLDYRQRLKLADALAKRHGRACMPVVVDMMIKGDWPPSPFFSIISVTVSDPDGHLKMREHFLDLGTSRGMMAVAGIALPADEEAQKQLIRAASAEYSNSAGFCRFACHFLRGFDLASVRPAIEEAVRRDKESSRENRSDAQYRMDLLEYFKFMDTLTPKERLASMDFNRRFWWARAMSDEATVSIFGEYKSAALFFDAGFVPADEQFLRHSLRLDADTDEAATAIGIAKHRQLRGLGDALRNYAKPGRKFSGYALSALRDLGLAETASTQPNSP